MFSTTRPAEYTIVTKDYNLSEVRFSINVEEIENGFSYDEATLILGSLSIEEELLANLETYKQTAITNYNIGVKKETVKILKKQLASSDYKIIKCYEASLLGEEMPYDFTELAKEREQLRDKINELLGE